MNGNTRTLPIRRWLALALVTIVLLPVLVAGSIFGHNMRSQFDPHQTVDPVREGFARWTDPAWQAATRERLQSRGADFVLFDGTGRELYRSVKDPLTDAEGNDLIRSVRKVTLTASDTGTAVGELDVVIGIAHIYTLDRPPARAALSMLAAVLVTLLLTLAVIGWFVDRSVVRPLAATGRAAGQVAGGDLDVSLPSSRVREVAEVNTAFEGMAGALRSSLRHQAALEQERRLFISAVAHDLRTPLFSLRGYLEGMQQGLAGTPEKLAHYITICREKAATLERLVSDLFDYTRFEYLEQAPEREPVDLGALLRRISDGARPQAATKGVNLELEGPPEPCVVDADPHLLTRAVENLLDNALRHTPAGGSIRLDWRREGDRAVFALTDTGPGIPPADLPHVFTPLYRGETSRNRRTGGAGLGLTIARRILRAHSGDLTAENVPGGGARLTGTLPVIHESRAAAQEGDLAKASS